MVIPTRLTALSVAVVALAALAFFATNGSGPQDTAAPVVATPSATPTPTATPSPTATRSPATKPTPRPKPTPALRRGETIVEVYNNSGITGLAGATASRASGAGWDVVGSDNWYGTIPATTVYYPDRLQRAAKALARDLGINRLKPAISPMRFDRLTVILTADYR